MYLHTWMDKMNLRNDAENYVGIQKRECAVKDNKGNHCPDKPKHFAKDTDGYVCELCDGCYQAWIRGSWQDQKRRK